MRSSTHGGACRHNDRELCHAATRLCRYLDQPARRRPHLTVSGVLVRLLWLCAAAQRPVRGGSAPSLLRPPLGLSAMGRQVGARIAGLLSDRDHYQTRADPTDEACPVRMALVSQDLAAVYTDVVGCILSAPSHAVVHTGLLAARLRSSYVSHWHISALSAVRVLQRIAAMDPVAAVGCRLAGGFGCPRSGGSGTAHLERTDRPPAQSPGISWRERLVANESRTPVRVCPSRRPMGNGPHPHRRIHSTFVHARSDRRLVLLADDLCRRLERPQYRDTGAFASDVVGLLLRLCVLAQAPCRSRRNTLLPDWEPIPRARQVRLALARLAGPANRYQDLFDPAELPSQDLVMYVSTDLGDIYEDLVQCRGRLRPGGMRDWLGEAAAIRSTYQYHWHLHATDVLRVLQYLALRPRQQSA